MVRSVTMRCGRRRKHSGASDWPRFDSAPTAVRAYRSRGVPVARLTALPEHTPTKPAATRKASRLTQALRADQRILRGMLRRAVNAFHLRLYVRGTLGLEDPSHTARALTAARQLNAAAGERVNVDLRDNFVDETSQLFGKIRAWVLPAEIVWVVVGWFVHPDTRRVLHGK